MERKFLIFTTFFLIIIQSFIKILIKKKIIKFDFEKTKEICCFMPFFQFSLKIASKQTFVLLLM